jgi:hypothetical protein
MLDRFARVQVDERNQNVVSGIELENSLHLQI